MTYEEARGIVEDYYLDHISTMTHREVSAFLICIISTPLVPLGLRDFTVDLAGQISTN